MFSISSKIWSTYNVRVCSCCGIFSGHIRMLRPPMGTPGFETKLLRNSLECSQCIPTCYETTHEIEMESSPDQRRSIWELYSYLDVAYGNLGAKKYQRDITFAWTELLGKSCYGIRQSRVRLKMLIRDRDIIYWQAKRAHFHFSIYPENSCLKEHVNNSIGNINNLKSMAVQKRKSKKSQWIY